MNVRYSVFDIIFEYNIWNGLEKQAEGQDVADSSAKLLGILEKIENNTEQSFSEIKTNISKLIQFGVETNIVGIETNIQSQLLDCSSITI